MQILRIKYRKNNADIETDEGTYPKVSLTALAHFGLTEGMEPDASRFNAFLEASEKDNAKEYIFGLLSRGAKTEKEARQKLREHKFSKRSADHAIAVAKEYGYLSDARYAVRYAETAANTKGAYRIKRELKQKGVADEEIESALSEVETDETEACAAVAARFMRGKELDEKTLERLYRHLSSRGFSYDAVKSSMRAVGREITDD